MSAVEKKINWNQSLAMFLWVILLGTTIGVSAGLSVKVYHWLATEQSCEGAK